MSTRNYCTLFQNENKDNPKIDIKVCERCNNNANEILTKPLNSEKDPWLLKYFSINDLDNYNSYYNLNKNSTNSNTTNSNTNNSDTNNNLSYSYLIVSFSTFMFILCEFFFWIASILLVHKYKESFTDDSTDENADADADTDTPSTQTKKSPAYIAGVSMIIMNIFTSLILLYLFIKCVIAYTNSQPEITFFSGINVIFLIFGIFTFIKIGLIAAYLRF